MQALASKLIDPWYKTMKSKVDSKIQNCWQENPLDMVNITSAAIDGYVSYELYRKYLLIQRESRVR